MHKYAIKYEDFNGNTRSEVLYFNLTVAEMIDIQANHKFGFQAEVEAALETEDIARLLAFMKELIHKSYGEKSEDGRHFRKSEQIHNDFINSAAYSPLLMSLFEDGGKNGSAFITALMPASLVNQANEQLKKSNAEAEATTAATVTAPVDLDATQQVDIQNFDNDGVVVAPETLEDPSDNPAFQQWLRDQAAKNEAPEAP